MLRSPESKVVSKNELTALAERLHKREKVIVSTNGCFDILHWGHISYLYEAKKMGNILICGVNSDASVKKLKGEGRPIHAEKIRCLQLAAIECVDYVTVFEEDTPINFITALHSDIHAKGADYEGKDIPEKGLLESWGGKMVFIPFVEGFSTSKLLSNRN
jgi:D-beta-D-heptose 7-phosphate kinase/D-beta-D-heptose 1-phosphate adenosyltransferase